MKTLKNLACNDDNDVKYNMQQIRKTCYNVSFWGRLNICSKQFKTIMNWLSSPPSTPTLAIWTSMPKRHHQIHAPKRIKAVANHAPIWSILGLESAFCLGKSYRLKIQLAWANDFRQSTSPPENAWEVQMDRNPMGNDTWMNRVKKPVHNETASGFKGRSCKVKGQKIE